MSPTLSILVITHNQLSLLKRCLDSVFHQKLNVPFEVVVSDDRSDDGTEEYMTDLCSSIKKLGVNNLMQVIYTRCNSNDCDPADVSERCGWNKLNVYLHSSGDFFVNIDADDYLKSNDIYQTQLDTLIAHPECSMCMQDVWQINDGDDIKNGFRWPSFGQLKNGQVLSIKDILTKYRAVNPCYMIRRHLEDNMNELYGKLFDDTIITQHHLQYGHCVYVDRADYVWVRYKSSITGTLSGDDELVSYSLLPLHHILLLPMFAGIFMEDALSSLIHFFKVLTNKNFSLSLTDRSLENLKRSDGYIYKILLTRIDFFNKMKLMYIRFLLLLTKKYNLHCSFVYKYLYGLLTNKYRVSLIREDYWQI